MAHLQGFMDFQDCYNSLKVVVVVFFFAKICQKVTLFFNGIFYRNYFFKNHFKAKKIVVKVVLLVIVLRVP